MPRPTVGTGLLVPYGRVTALGTEGKHRCPGVGDLNGNQKDTGMKKLFASLFRVIKKITVEVARELWDVFKHLPKV